MQIIFANAILRCNTRPMHCREKQSEHSGDNAQDDDGFEQSDACALPAVKKQRLHGTGLYHGESSSMQLWRSEERLSSDGICRLERTASPTELGGVFRWGCADLSQPTVSGSAGVEW